MVLRDPLTMLVSRIPRVVQTTSAQRVTNCYKHCRTGFTAYRDDISSESVVLGSTDIVYFNISLFSRSLVWPVDNLIIQFRE